MSPKIKEHEEHAQDQPGEDLGQDRGE